jgi:hypothetical protein
LAHAGDLEFWGVRQHRITGVLALGGKIEDFADHIVGIQLRQPAGLVKDWMWHQNSLKFQD